MADGDYGPDKFSERFPKWAGVTRHKQASAAPPALTFDDLFERWRLERKPSASTVTTWLSYVRALKKQLGHNDPHRVTKSDLLAWKDALITAGYALKGIRDGQLASVRTLYAYAVDNDLLTANPAQGIKIQIKRRAGSGKQPYTDQEVARILELADKERKPELRWLPWLMAMSGARVGEVAQLWGSRITNLEGIYVMQIAPAEDGGSLKNEGSERTVPIHPAILERGFLDFVLAKGEGPLFYGGGRKRSSSRTPGQRHTSKGPTNRLAGWVRKQGFTDGRKSPTHAFRHWFKTACQKAGVQDSVADAIQGHSGNRGEADGYRHTGIRVMADAIARIRVPCAQAGVEREGTSAVFADAI
jgi:integrase